MKTIYVPPFAMARAAAAAARGNHETDKATVDIEQRVDAALATLAARAAARRAAQNGVENS